MGGGNSSSNHFRRVRGLSLLSRLKSLVLVFAVGLFLQGCSNSAPKEQSSESGWVLYKKHCSICHGPDGGGYVGPAIIGANSALESYGTAQGLLDYISATMPQNYPGSLSDKEYKELLALLLIQNKIVPHEWSAESEELNEINLSERNCGTETC